MSWRTCTDWAKRSPFALRVADRLGRGTGRLRLLDRLSPAPNPLHIPDLTGWESHDLAAAWLGHATILMRLGGMTLLTDPVLSDRVGIGLGLMTGGPRRHIAAALRVHELPRLDLILISHAHFDHLDRPTLARLPRDVRIITARHTSDLIADLGFSHITELDWGEETRVDGLHIQAHEVRHWGARTFFDSHRGFNSYVLSTKDRRVLYGGDSAYYTGFSDAAPVDLAILGIAAYNPYIQAHANPEQAWEMARQAHARFVLPMHHSTFRLSHEPMDEPLKRLLAAAGDEADRVVVRHIGEVWIADRDTVNGKSNLVTQHASGNAT